MIRVRQQLSKVRLSTTPHQNGAGIFKDATGTTTVKNTIITKDADVVTGDNCSGGTIGGDNHNISWPDTRCPGMMLTRD